MSVTNINLVSQVKEYATLSAFPVTGAEKTIYIDESTDLPYYWKVNAYFPLGSGGGGSTDFASITGDPYDNTNLADALDLKADESDLQTEITNRTNADSTLQGNINNEATTRAAADNSLQTQITSAQSDIDTHEARTDNPHLVTLEQARSENNQITGNIDANGNQIDNLSNPSQNQQASTKGYTDAAQAAAQAYADSLVVAVFRPAGDWDASVGTYPASGTGSGGAIRRGDTYRITVAGNMGGYAYDVGDSIYAIIATPGQSAANWGDFEHNTQQATEVTRGTALIIDATTAANENTTDDQKMVTGKKLWSNFWQRVLALAWTWSLKQTFTSAPRFNSGAANQIVELDANKDLTTAAKGTAYNKNFGTGTVNVPEIGATLSASLILATDANGKLVVLPAGTYPSLSELAFLKGVTSAVQTQLNGKASTAVHQIHAAHSTISYGANTTYYFGDNPSAQATTADTVSPCVVMKTGSMTRITYSIRITNIPSSANVLHQYRIGVAGAWVTFATVDWSTQANGTVKGLAILGAPVAVNAGDLVYFRHVTPNPWTTLPGLTASSNHALIE